MFFLRRPSPPDIDRFLRAARNLPLSYEPVGLAQGRGAGFQVDEQVTIVGSGEAAFARARDALTAWTHFGLGWVELFPKGAAISPGTNVAVLARHVGFWSLNACRVVYSIGGPDETKFGFAYGTLPDHIERGEEIFTVSFRPETGDVSYLIRAASKPHAALAWLGYPLTRAFQARFRHDSTAALRRAIDG